MRKAGALTSVGAAALLSLLASDPSLCQGRYESAPTFTPARALPPDLAQGPYHTIVGRVPVEGFLDHFQMQTKWGTFNVDGIELLRMRVREAAATAKLEQVDSAGTLVSSAGRTALKPVEDR